MNVKKSTLIKFFPLIFLYVSAVITFVFMAFDSEGDLCRSFITGILGIYVFMPLLCGVLAGFVLWARKIEEKENES